MAYVEVTPAGLQPGDEFEVRGRRGLCVVDTVGRTHQTALYRVSLRRSHAGNKRQPIYLWPHERITVRRD